MSLHIDMLTIPLRGTVTGGHADIRRLVIVAQFVTVYVVPHTNSQEARIFRQSAITDTDFI